MGNVDKVAEAICRENRGPVWCEIPDVARDQYRHMAQAAIDSLELTAEWGVITDMGVETTVTSEHRAKQLANRWDDMFVRSRLVSPWVRSEADQ